MQECRHDAALRRGRRPEGVSAADSIVYLDSGFQTPLARPVKEAYERFLREGYETAGPKQVWLNRLEETRAKLARFIGARPEEIAFTKNTSESMNIAANALPLRPGDKVLLIDGDHPTTPTPSST